MTLPGGGWDTARWDGSLWDYQQLGVGFSTAVIDEQLKQILTQNPPTGLDISWQILIDGADYSSIASEPLVVSGSDIVYPAASVVLSVDSVPDIKVNASTLVMIFTFTLADGSEISSVQFTGFVSAVEPNRNPLVRTVTIRGKTAAERVLKAPQAPVEQSPELQNSATTLTATGDVIGCGGTVNVDFVEHNVNMSFPNAPTGAYIDIVIHDGIVGDPAVIPSCRLVAKAVAIGMNWGFGEIVGALISSPFNGTWTAVDVYLTPANTTMKQILGVPSLENIIEVGLVSLTSAPTQYVGTNADGTTESAAFSKEYISILPSTPVVAQWPAGTDNVTLAGQFLTADGVADIAIDTPAYVAAADSNTTTANQTADELVGALLNVRAITWRHVDSFGRFRAQQATKFNAPAWYLTADAITQLDPAQQGTGYCTRASASGTVSGLASTQVYVDPVNSLDPPAGRGLIDGGNMPSAYIADLATLAELAQSVVHTSQLFPVSFEMSPNPFLQIGDVVQMTTQDGTINVKVTHMEVGGDWAGGKGFWPKCKGVQQP